MKRLFLLPVLVLFLGAQSQPPPRAIKLRNNPALTVADPGQWSTVQNGIEFRKISLERNDPGYAIELKLARLDPELFAARVLYGVQHNLGVTDVKTLAEKTQAVAAINANYFDPEGRPLAFLKTAAKAVNRRVAQAAIYSGVFGVKDGKPFIKTRNEFSPDQADEGIQSGPLLLRGGRNQTINGVPNRLSRRAVIALDKQQRVIIAVTDNVLGGLSWSELQELFSSSRWQLDVADLLALDGGGSAQMFLNVGSFEEFVPGASEVPVAIGFFPRSR